MKLETIISIIGIILSTAIGIYQIILSKRVKNNELEIKKIISHNSKINNQEGQISGIVGNSNNGDISNNVIHQVKN